MTEMHARIHGFDGGVWPASGAFAGCRSANGALSQDWPGGVIALQAAPTGFAQQSVDGLGLQARGLNTTRWVNDGSAEAVLQAIRGESIARQALAAQHLLAVVSQRTNLAARPRFDGWAR